jgi:hypothetical protein
MALSVEEIISNKLKEIMKAAGMNSWTKTLFFECDYLIVKLPFQITGIQRFSSSFKKQKLCPYFWKYVLTWKIYTNLTTYL